MSGTTNRFSAKSFAKGIIPPMGFYIRKSVSVGPLRFNLSKSGIGVSAGVRGFRVGSGPGGNYVHMGRGGLYYRHTLPLPQPGHAPSERPRNSVVELTQRTHGPMQEITSVPASTMVDSSSAQLLSELNGKFNRLRLWPLAGIASIILLVLLVANGVALWLAALVALFSIACTIAAYMRDMLAKSVVVMYDLDESLAKPFEDAYQSVVQIARCAAVWHVTSLGNVYDRKYHAGASRLINRHRTRIHERTPPHVKTNVATACIPLGNNSLYFLPDRILVWSSSGIGALAYTDFEVDIHETTFIEDGSVPSDSKVVGRTWRYINKGGGPDRRFNNNPELPICQYEELRFSSASGLNEVIQVSSSGHGISLKTNVHAMAHAIEASRKAEQQRQEHQAENARVEEVHLAKTNNQTSRSIVSPESDVNKHSLEFICDALLNILCAVMVADGRVSKSEHACIIELMRKVNSPFTVEHVEHRMNAYIDSISTIGYKKVLTQSLEKVSMFRTIGKADVLIRCIDVLAAADSKLDEREQALCARIKHLVTS